MSVKTPKFQELVTKLREIFQIDRPELDFGIYRILNARADEINDYLEKRLPEKVQAALSSGSEAQREQIARELQEKEEQYTADGLEPSNVPKVQELRQKLAEYSVGAAEHENAVFSHLLTFFSRYYDNGDFISQRRYKGDTYAIPYAGEEVMLHWANKDQYYTKSGENFANYSFKLEDGRTVHFRLISADTAKDNRKDNEKERRFALIHSKTVIRTDEEGEEYEEQLIPIEEVDGVNGKELVIRFEYAPQPKGTKQDALVSKAVDAVLTDEAVTARWLDLANRAPTEKNPQRTLLEKYLTDYTTKNTADYFIHKDLGSFLRRELDFYIKNEVMHLDDVQNASAFADIEKNLRMMQCLRAISLELIDFLAQLEDFQKKLWLKKKFVVSSHYCITLDRVPEELYPEIVANEKQWEQWFQLGVWGKSSPGTLSDLKAGMHRMMDTSLFEEGFGKNILSLIDGLDEKINGLLVHGDNFHGLLLLQEKYRESLACVYIDPPYNTDATVINYKNGYRESSWLSLISSRMGLGKNLLRSDGVHILTIDDYEHAPVRQVLDAAFSEDSYLATVVVRNNPSGRSTVKGFSINHEFALFYGAEPNKARVGRLPHSEQQKSRYDLVDEFGPYEWENFRKSSAGSDRASRPKQFYPLYVSLVDYSVRVPDLMWLDLEGTYELITAPSSNEEVVWPLDLGGRERVWRWGLERASAEVSTLVAKKPKGGSKIEIYGRKYLNEEGILPRTWWDKPEYSARDNGTRMLREMFSQNISFDFPKALNAVSDSIRIGSPDPDGIVLDYYGGSGTTAHAVINLNRYEKQKKKFIIVEQGDYFESVTKSRVIKSIYSPSWRKGKPTTSENGISFCFKVLKLESYEDTLNNLQLHRDAKHNQTLGLLDQQAKDDYLLHYMLDVESRGSLLSVEDFKKPFDYSMNIATDSAGAYEPTQVDLVETFNYLIGLRVKHLDAQLERGFVTVNGTLPSGESCLVLWRDCDLLDYEGVSRLCDKLAINPADNEFDVVYINGDHNIPTVLTQTSDEGGATRVLKLRQIEPEFLERMFSVEDV
ncbi:adenine-specific DNA-methyltransferase [Halopseudomonas litoralis]|uniref:Adenine-specific DNA-methyltransferase n=1 Tax=Halopseudomonas litoralis TaxID=797277 RepID=A0A1H1Y8G3_9GAMM|nr:site-specific DNA-methyltransferase [Halopseudomonas litoralis]SDT17306.1 adenine-specific DNA-methyltransferase [Halopseudomonas litoralis]